jgi:hypothetical protein
VDWPLVLERSLALHEALEQGDRDGAAAALFLAPLDTDASLRARVAALPCARTGLPPLHKALQEGGGGSRGGGSGASPRAWVEVLALLLASGADPAATVDLYDGLDAPGLATKFGRGADLDAALALLKQGQDQAAPMSAVAAYPIEAPEGVEVIED